MTAREMFERYCTVRGADASAPYTVWPFGGAPDKLAALVTAGIKTATASAYELFGEPGSETMPRVGDINVITDSRERPVCVIRTVELNVVPFRDVTPQHARMEGEGDGSLAYWRQVHRDFFTDELAAAGRAFSEDMPVLCERFEVVYQPGTTVTVMETPRLRLRLHTWDDLENMETVLCDRENMRFYRDPFTRDTVRRWLSWHMTNYADLGFGLFAVELKDTGEYIGDCGLTMQRIHGKLAPEIGYHLRRDCHGRGYATEAAHAVRDWAFTHTPFMTLYSYMEADNQASQAVACRNGMHKVDSCTDGSEALVVYAVTRQEWELLT